MRHCLVYFSFLLLVSCRQKESDVASITYPIGNSVDWLNGDENFDVKHWKGGKSKDSVRNLFTLYNDLNNDGIIDTTRVIGYALRNQTEIKFTCFKSLLINHLMEDVQITDAGDLNGDGLHELMVLQQGSESCWDNLKLYSLINDNWVEKYSGMTYQCIENPMYSFVKLNDNTIQIVTFGESRDSIDRTNGDTLEQVLPNEQRTHIIKW